MLLLLPDGEVERQKPAVSSNDGVIKGEKWLIREMHITLVFRESLAILPTVHTWQVCPARHEFTLRWQTGSGVNPQESEAIRA